MSLSTSSSDHASDGDWRRWLAILVVALATGALLFLALVVVIDPYSSGHFTPFTSVDITTFNRLYMNAGRVRDTRFDAAIFGTSTSILIDPAPIGQATAHRFVLLSIEGAYPPEHHYLVDRFDRLHRDKPAILVVVLDDLWCVPKIVNTGPIIPRWLYEGLLPDYLQKILSHEAAKASLLRVCAVERRRFPVGASPTRQPLQPEATGAVMEVTKWLKPLVSVSRIGDSAILQAVTRVHAEQAS